MHTRLLALVTLLVPVAGMGLVSACGQTNDNGDGGPSDAAPDKTMTMDVSTQDVMEEPDVSCPPPLNLDGGIGIDAGAFGGCLTCLTSDCSSEITACNNDCACRQDVATAITCFTTMPSVSCVNALTGSTAGVNLLACAYSKCQNICLGGAGDGGTDAAADAPDGD